MQTVLDEWLELVALTDIAEKYQQVAHTLADAEQHGWHFQDPEAMSFFSQINRGEEYVSKLEEQCLKWNTIREDREAELRKFSVSHTGPETTPDSTRPTLSPSDIETLDALGRQLFVDLETPLGVAIQIAIAKGHPVTDRALKMASKDLTIGEGDWMAVWSAYFSDVRVACDQARSPGPTPSWPGEKVPLGFQNFIEVHKQWTTASNRLNDTFLKKIGVGDESGRVLNDALNELMALFTPARWAYNDIALEHRTTDSGNRIDIAQSDDAKEGVATNLRLNTAELNLFTVALFLLCTPRVNNPLRLLVLDDPLQNMDELTTVTLARALAKVVRLWEDSWQLILLFHGEDDLERFCTEVPAAVYFLPWLSPGTHDKEAPLTGDKEKSRVSTQVQDIENLVDSLEAE